MNKAFEKSIKKDFGDGIIQTGNIVVDRENVVIPLSPSLDMICQGIPEGSFVTFTGLPKCGKGGDLTTIIYTTHGPKLLGTLTTEDVVVTPNGGRSKIVNIFNRGFREIYEVKFSDGSSCRCDDEHLWMVSKTIPHGQYNWKLLELKEINKRTLFYSDGRPKWAIPLTKPVNYPFRHINIPPYVLGVLLGDGSISNSSIGLTSKNRELVTSYNSLLDDGFNFKKLNTSDIEYRLNTSRQPNKYRIYLEKYGLLGCTSHSKFIPEDYLYNSIEIRKELLKGLLDTDGTISKRGHVSYTTTSGKLAKHIRLLIQSLGGLSKIKQRITYCQGKAFKSYRLSANFNDTTDLFTLPYKLERTRVRKKSPLTRKIIEIKHLGKRPCKCIKIADDKGLYLTDHYIVTHNTTTSLHFAAKCQKPEYGGELCPKGRDVHFISVEGRLKKRDLEGIPGLDLERVYVTASRPGKILTAEEFLDIAERAIKDWPGSLVIIDSYSALCTEAESTAGVGENQRASLGGPKALARFCRRTCNIVPVNKNIVIGITHLMGNPTGWGAETREKSGYALRYHVDVHLKSTGFRAWRVPANKGVQIGQEIDWQCITSAIGAPGAKSTGYLRYGKGIDECYEFFILATDIGLITNETKGWYEFAFLGKKSEKFHGAEKSRQALIDNPEWYDILVAKVKELIQ